ncbi:UPF0187-domain-containing protein [Corynespora cassiicola Philippines]|uniref:UPF0187-domain-containing protein n=1 Tax=Corynespora cassiicola Philippines TaxID=1448308 RepID=A0A2T2PB70_CORCC|nr:UPF0187-domain-containing protein [Corynespora cassiicola Philippines]
MFSKEGSASNLNLKKSRQALEGYFIGPRDIGRHSKWPRALRMHGSVTPKLIVPVFGIALWASAVTCFSEKVHSITVHPIITTVLGIVVGLAINFRTSTAYERYMEGRRLWSFLAATSENLARVIWVHTEERKGKHSKSDLVGKITGLNMIIAFSVALKHKLRFEPYIQYDDLFDLVSHLDTFAKSAGEPQCKDKKVRTCKLIAQRLWIPMARSNPRKELKRAKRPLGNLPLEILTYLSAYVNETCNNNTLTLPIAQTHALNNLQSLNEILTNCDRILNTPLPIAYTIAISQITWLYVITLPFQLVDLMGWVSIPATTVAAYIILGIAAIGHEIENPFGPEVNDLPMELYCSQITSHITIIASRPGARFSEFALHPENKPLYPISSSGTDFWMSRDENDIREALGTRASVSRRAMWQRQSSLAESEGESVTSSPAAASFLKRSGTSATSAARHCDTSGGGCGE